MGRHNDNAPIGYTCNKINDVINFLESIEWSEDEIDLAKECETMIDVMEEIRTANDILRHWGNDLHNEKEEIERDKYSIEIECERLQEENNYLNDKVVDLEDEIRTLTNE